MRRIEWAEQVGHDKACQIGNFDSARTLDRGIALSDFENYERRYVYEFKPKLMGMADRIRVLFYFSTKGESWRRRFII
jgi:hypothetical protein